MLGQEGNEAEGQILQLRQFADTLFGHLYFRFGLQRGIPAPVEHCEDIIVWATLCVERAAYKFNYRIFDSILGNNVDNICEEVCESYPDDDYFLKLFYASAFILDFVWWYSKYVQTIDLRQGPRIWVRMFMNDFNNQFEQNGGWQGFAKAGKRVWGLRIFCGDEDSWRQLVLPSTYIDEISSRMYLLPPFPEPTVEEITSDFEQLSLDDEIPFYEEESEDNQSETEDSEDSQPAPEKPHGDQPEPEKPHGDQPAPEESHDDQPAPEESHDDQPAPEESYDDQPAPEESHDDQPAPEGNVQIENPQEGTSKQTQLSRVVTTQQSSARPPKRGHDTVAEDSDKPASAKRRISIAELAKASLEASIEIMKKTPLKRRRYDPDTKDSDDELYPPTSSKVKMEKK